jgi:ATP-dependent DNA helicase RecG
LRPEDTEALTDGRELAMEEVLLLPERILQTIALGESQFREFKSAWEGPPGEKKPRDRKAVAKDVAETLVAFANADGGELLVGVEDDGQITSFSYPEQTVVCLLEAPRSGVHRDTPLASPIAQRVNLDDRVVLYFSVEKKAQALFTKPVTVGV